MLKDDVWGKSGNRAENTAGALSLHLGVFHTRSPRLLGGGTDSVYIPHQDSLWWLPPLYCLPVPPHTHCALWREKGTQEAKINLMKLNGASIMSSDLYTRGLRSWRDCISTPTQTHTVRLINLLPFKGAGLLWVTQSLFQNLPALSSFLPHPTQPVLSLQPRWMERISSPRLPPFLPDQSITWVKENPTYIMDVKSLKG